MRTLKFAAVILATLSLFGCGGEASWSDIELVDSKTGILLGPRLFYRGSDASRHYFRIAGHESLDEVSDIFVKKSVVPVSIKEQPFSTKESDWVCLDRRISSSGTSYIGGLKTLTPAAP